MVGRVWAWTEFLVCVLFASCSHLELSFGLLEAIMRAPPASPAIRTHGLLWGDTSKSYREESCGDILFVI